MSKKINFTTINAESINVISNYNIADCTLVELADAHKTALKRFNNELEAVHKDIESETANNTLTQVKKQEYDAKIFRITEKIRKENTEYAESEKRKSATITKKKALETVPEDLYNAYVQAWEKGADGKLGDALQEFLVKLGVDGAENQSARRRFASLIKTRIGGSKKASMKQRKEDGIRITVKSNKQFNDIFMLTFIDYLVSEKIVNENDQHEITLA